MKRSGARGLPNPGPAAAQANRRALLSAAREVFAEQGLEAPLTTVARRAGVGQGSLYRHFPNRLALAMALVSQDMDQLEAHDASGGDLPGLLDLMAVQTLSNREVATLVVQNRDDPRGVDLVRRFRDLMARLLAREQEAGRVRGDRDVEDVAMLARMLMDELVRDRADGGDERRRRLIVMFSDALVTESTGEHSSQPAERRASQPDRAMSSTE